MIEESVTLQFMNLLGPESTRTPPVIPPILSLPEREPPEIVMFSNVTGFAE